MTMSRGREAGAGASGLRGWRILGIILLYRVGMAGGMHHILVVSQRILL